MSTLADRVGAFSDREVAVYRWLAEADVLRHRHEAAVSEELAKRLSAELARRALVWEAFEAQFGGAGSITPVRPISLYDDDQA